MNIRRVALRQIDVKRCLSGVRAAGFEPEEIIITASGEIRVRLTQPGGAMSAVEREVEQFFAQR
jgi:hypothetical protein